MRGTVARGLRRSLGPEAAKVISADFGTMASWVQKNFAEVARVRDADRSDVLRIQALLTRGFWGRLRWLFTGN